MNKYFTDKVQIANKYTKMLDPADHSRNEN